MFDLNLPKYEAKIIRRNEKHYIWDCLRRRYIALTPEEWVRQHFVHYLIEYKSYPAALLANEVSLRLHGMIRRCDTVLYDREVRPRMIIEYKAPHIPVTQQVFDQICRYNFVLQVDYLIVSNGLEHYCCRLDYKENNYTFLPQIPAFSELGVKLSSAAGDVK